MLGEYFLQSGEMGWLENRSYLCLVAVSAIVSTVITVIGRLLGKRREGREAPGATRRHGDDLVQETSEPKRDEEKTESIAMESELNPESASHADSSDTLLLRDLNSTNSS